MYCRFNKSNLIDKTKIKTHSDNIMYFDSLITELSSILTRNPHIPVGTPMAVRIVSKVARKLRMFVTGTGILFINLSRNLKKFKYYHHLSCSHFKIILLSQIFDLTWDLHHSNEYIKIVSFQNLLQNQYPIPDNQASQQYHNYYQELFL